MVRLAPDVLVLDRYRVVAPPTSPCAWGDVLLATDCLLGRYVDLVTAPAPLETPVGGHFARRAHAVAGARHPALPLVYDVATHDDYPVLVGQHIEGRALAHVIGADAPWTAARALRLVERLSAALGEAHIQGLCHGAFSVDSVVLGWGDDAYIHDLAWPRGAAAHALEAAAPEVRAGAPPTRHSDVFALGYLLSQLLGGTPRTSNAPGVIEWAGTPVGVRDVLTRSMALAPDNRYDNGSEMALAISAVLSRARTVEHTQALPTISLAHTQAMPIIRAKRRRTRPVVGAAVAATVLSVGLTMTGAPARAARLAGAALPPHGSLAQMWRMLRGGANGLDVGRRTPVGYGRTTVALLHTATPTRDALSAVARATPMRAASASAASALTATSVPSPSPIPTQSPTLTTTDPNAALPGTAPAPAATADIGGPAGGPPPAGGDQLGGNVAGPGPAGGPHGHHHGWDNTINPPPGG